MTAPYTPQQRFEAARWFVDIEAEDPAPETLQRWTSWMESSEGNRLAFEAVERAWHGAPTSSVAPGGVADVRDVRDVRGVRSARDEAYDASVPVAQWLQRRDTAVRSQPRARRWMSLAACLALLFGIWWAADRAVPVRHSTGEFATATSEHMEISLGDGSHVTLGARTRISVGYTPKERKISLLSGEAYFAVRKDPSRPFSVHALGGRITALGTAFNVRATENQVTVAVTEGAVEVAGTPPSILPRPLDERVNLRSGDQLIFTVARDSPRIEEAARTRLDTRRAISWRDGWLVYRDEPLRYVIADVARYTDRHVAVSESIDPSLRFTGAVYRGSVVEWLEALPAVFPVDTRSSADEVLVAPR
jgi:transmembrane sensor